jgi:hypothetical protein
MKDGINLQICTREHLRATLQECLSCLSIRDPRGVMATGFASHERHQAPVT